MAAFGASLDALEHPALHDKADRFDHMPQHRLAARVTVELPGYQPGAPATVNRAEHPLPHIGKLFRAGWHGQRSPGLAVRANQDQGMWRLRYGHPEAGGLGRGEQDQVADVQLLEFGDYPAGAVDVAAQQVSSASKL